MYQSLGSDIGSYSGKQLPISLEVVWLGMERGGGWGGNVGWCKGECWVESPGVTGRVAVHFPIWKCLSVSPPGRRTPPLVNFVPCKGRAVPAEMRSDMCQWLEKVEGWKQLLGSLGDGRLAGEIQAWQHGPGTGNVLGFGPTFGYWCIYQSTKSPLSPFCSCLILALVSPCLPVHVHVWGLSTQKEKSKISFPSSLIPNTLLSPRSSLTAISPAKDMPVEWAILRIWAWW